MVVADVDAVEIVRRLWIATPLRRYFCATDVCGVSDIHTKELIQTIADWIRKCRIVRKRVGVDQSVNDHLGVFRPIIWKHRIRNRSNKFDNAAIGVPFEPQLVRPGMPRPDARSPVWLLRDWSIQRGSGCVEQERVRIRR